MFPTPLAKTSRTWQISYQVLLPFALIVWLLPLKRFLIWMETGRWKQP